MTDTSARILVVDDEVPVREVLSEYFTAQGYAVESVSNSLDALAAAERQRPDVVVLDIGLPGFDNLEMLKRLRNTVPSAEVIMLSGEHDARWVRETLNANTFNYAEDRLDVQRLGHAVSAAISRARAHEARERLRYAYLIGFACFAVVGVIVFELARRHLMNVSWFAGMYFVLMSGALACGFYAVARLILLEREIRPPQTRPDRPDEMIHIA